MDEIGETPEGQRIVNFRILYMIAQMLGVTIIILMGAWITIFLGGFGWSTPKIEFNWHPMLMTIGMIYLFGNCKNSFIDQISFNQYFTFKQLHCTEALDILGKRL